MHFELILILVLIAAALGGGYFLATHQHKLAVATASAITRASTIPSGDVTAINDKIDGLGTQVNKLTTAVGAAAATVVNNNAGAAKS